MPLTVAIGALAAWLLWQHANDAMLRRADDARHERMERDRLAEIVKGRQIARRDLLAEMHKRLDAGESPGAVRAWVEQREREIADETRRGIEGK